MSRTGHMDSSHRSCIGDHNHASTSYGSFSNWGQHASGQGIINNNYQTANPLEELDKHCSPSAAFDSAARFDPPRCTESTRFRIIQIIEEWIINDEDDGVPSSLFWLHGGAGVGKSALAQSLSEKFQQKEQLAASFFFFRSDPSRNNGEYLIPTLASHLIDSFEGIRPFVENGIHKNRTLFTKKFEVQIQELLIKPLLALESKKTTATHCPRLVVIDGLDECENANIQCALLRVIARAIPQIPYPLRFLVTSRPEAHITDTFNHDHDLQVITIHRYNLSEDPDADMDIRKFLEKEFAEIQRAHPLRHHLPHAWPDRKNITSLVERSSGHFIHASTVIRYIRSPKHRPEDRLEIVLRLRPPQEGDRPYAQLDALYGLIFDGVASHSQLRKICLVLGILYLQSKKVGFFTMFPYYSIEWLLDMKPGDLVLLLDPILSLVAIDGDNVRILHKSLIDYLLDFTRGGHLPFDLARVHESVANYMLERWDERDFYGMKGLRHFAYHCQYASLNDTLQDFLHAIGVPSPRSLMTRSNSPFLFLPSDDQLAISNVSVIWHVFRTLSRQDFSDGQIYEEYVGKWMHYLRSAVPMRTRLVFRGRGSGKMHDLKPGIDTLLMEWKPPNLNQKGVGMDQGQRLAFIKQEHSVFSAFVNASVFGDPTASNFNEVASSLVVGDHFIHSYNFGIWALDSFLSVRSYSRHDNTCCHYMRVQLEGDLNVVWETRLHLRTAEKYLFSELYQKYGVEPDEDEGLLDSLNSWSPHY